MRETTLHDAIDDTVTLDVTEDGDSDPGGDRYITVNLHHDDGTALGIALTTTQAHALAYTLHMYAARVDSV
jgi:hypothetical protein